MHNLKGTYLRQYRKNGKLVFVYVLVGSVSAIEAYQTLKGEDYRETDDKKPLFFTTRYAGKTCAVVVNEDTEKIYVDNSELDQANNIVEQMGDTPLGKAIAQQLATRILGNQNAVASIADEKVNADKA